MDSRDRYLAEISRRQHGVLARRQMERIGLSEETIDRWIRKGKLHRIHPGVYALGHPAITVRGRWMAAVLASGPDAVLSHRSAAALWGIWGSGNGQTHVTVARKTRSRRSIRRHFGALPSDEVTVREEIPVTTAARAVLDLAADKGEAAAESALREMEYLRIYGPVSLPSMLARHPKHRGTPILARCLERLDDDPGGRIRSSLEESFLPFLDAHHIPRPHLNAWLSVDDHRYQVDCLWPEARLVGELDDFRSHGTRRGFRKDRERDRRLLASSYRVVRVTQDQLTPELARDLRTLLESAPATATTSRGRGRGRRAYICP